MTCAFGIRDPKELAKGCVRFLVANYRPEAMVPLCNDRKVEKERAVVARRVMLTIVQAS